MIVFAALAILAGACSDSGTINATQVPVDTTLEMPSSSSSVTPVPPTTEPPDSTGGSTPSAVTATPVLLDRVPLIDLLALVPDNESTRQWVRIDDHDLTRRIEGVGDYDPAGQSPNRWVASWYPPSMHGSFFLGHGFPSVEDVDEYLREFGVWIDTADQEITYGYQPYHTQVITFDDSAAVDEAVRNDPVWSDVLEVTADPPVTKYLWDDERTSLYLATAPRPRGEAGQLVVLEGMAPRTCAADDLLIRTYLAEQAEVALGPIVGSSTSLADDKAYQALAGLLDAEGASSVMLTADTMVASQHGYGIQGDPLDFLATNPLLGPYEALAIGRVPRDGDWSTIMVLTHETQQAADENARRLARQLESGTTRYLETYADFLTLDTLDIIGTLVVARFAPGDRGSWKTLEGLFLQFESLFWIDDVRPKLPSA